MRACAAFHLHGTETTCQTARRRTAGQGRREAFLEAVTPAGVAASTRARSPSSPSSTTRGSPVSGSRSSAPSSKPSARSASSTRASPRTGSSRARLERKLEDALAGVEREQRTLAALEHARPAPLTDQERRALTRLARDLPKLWAAKTRPDRDRKELLRTLISEVVITVRRPENIAEVEIFWEGGARSELTVRLIRRGGESTRTDEDTIELIRRLAAHHPDQQIAAILNRQGRRTGTGLPFTEARVKGARQRAGIPAAPPPDPNSQSRHHRAGRQRAAASRRQRSAGGCTRGPASRRASHARTRRGGSGSPTRSAPGSCPTIPDGFVALNEAARHLGVARQTVLHKVQRGELHAVHVTRGRRKGLRIQVAGAASWTV